MAKLLQPGITDIHKATRTTAMLRLHCRRIQACTMVDILGTPIINSSQTSSSKSDIDPESGFGLCFFFSDWFCTRGYGINWQQASSL
ncbi:hypothetical protein LINPERHAP1_LOCUS11564 [Linum perenne]